MPVTVRQLVRPNSELIIIFMSGFSYSAEGSVGGNYLPSLAAIRCHGAVGSRMERDTIRTDVVHSFDYIDFTVGSMAQAQST